jgi:hypothetical protein
MCTGLKPGVKELAEPLLIARRRLEMSGRTPPVGHEGVVGHVLTEFSQGLTAVALPVLNLIADSVSDLPSQAISAGARCQRGWPGTLRKFSAL